MRSNSSRGRCRESYRPLRDVRADRLEALRARDLELPVALATARVEHAQLLEGSELADGRLDQRQELARELRHGHDAVAVGMDQLGARAEAESGPAVLGIV